MLSERDLSWLGREKERKALELCSDHMEKIVETTGLMREVVRCFTSSEKNIDKKKEAVLNREKDADKVKKEILEELSRGNYPPLNREMIVRFCMTVDDIGDNARAAAAKLTFVDPESVDKNVKDGLSHLSEKAYKSACALKEVFSVMLREDIEKSIERTHDVESLEEEADSFRAEELTPELVEWANRLKEPGTSGLVKEIEANIEEVLDRAEDSADIMREIAISTS